FDLANREVFDFVDLNLYISNDSIKKYNFICDIQLSVSTGLY
ncbi:6794_t:CDS:1, partial [Rhizophagus irregularis]